MDFLHLLSHHSCWWLNLRWGEGGGDIRAATNGGLVFLGFFFFKPGGTLLWVVVVVVVLFSNVHLLKHESSNNREILFLDLEQRVDQRSVPDVADAPLNSEFMVQAEVTAAWRGSVMSPLRCDLWFHKIAKAKQLLN